MIPLSPASNTAVILPQPRAPAVKDLFPSLPAHHPALLGAAKSPSTYIGKVDFLPTLPPVPSSDDNSSEKIPPAAADPRPLLFAQSSSSYPLVKVFDHPPNPVTKINGTFILSDELPTSDDLLPANGGLGPLERHAREQRLLDPPKEESVRISAPESTEAQLDLLIRQREDEHRRWWWIMAAEAVGVVVTGIAVYRWAFTKATKAAAAEKPLTDQSALLTPLSLDDEKRAATPTVRFEALPDTGSNGGNSDTPKKKSTRRRVRGKKKRRNSVGPELDRDEADGDGDGDGDDAENDGMSSTSDERSKSEERKVEKPLPDLPRNPSSISVHDHDQQERLAISDTVIGFGSHGTVVLKGTWGGRPVAVKRLLSDFVRLASQEVKLLQASDDHPNVIRCEYTHTHSHKQTPGRSC